MTQTDLRTKYADWVQRSRIEDPHIPIRALIQQIEAKEHATVNTAQMQRLLYEFDLPGEHPPEMAKEMSLADFQQNAKTIGHCYVGQPHLSAIAFRQHLWQQLGIKYNIGNVDEWIKNKRKTKATIEDLDAF